MHRDLLSHLPVIVAVARRGGFAIAARELGMSASAVSHAVRLVEERLGTAIFVRTTRAVAVTPEGKALIDGISNGLSLIDEQIQTARGARGQVTGILRLNIPRVALPMGLSRVIAACREAHPELQIELNLDDGLRDVFAEGFDAGIRLGGLVAQDLIAVRLTPPFRALMVAAPDYLAKAGMPQTLSHLKDHACIGYRMVTGRGLYKWDLYEDGRDVSIEVPSTLVVNDMPAALDLARLAIGITYSFEPLAQADIALGNLRLVLEHAAIEEDGLFVYFPAQSRQTPKLRAFLDVMKTARAGQQERQTRIDNR